MIANIIVHFWFPIIFVSVMVISIWRGARRLQSSAAVDEPVTDPDATSAITRLARSVPMRIASVVFALTLIGVNLGRWRVQLVERTTRDYVLLALIALTVGALIVFGREGLSARARSNLGYLTVVGMAVAWTMTDGLLLFANALLDTGPPREFTAVVAARSCSRPPEITVRGAPRLPIEADTMRVNVGGDVCSAVRAGDAVVVVTRPGFFGRPWIQAVRVALPPGLHTN
jgi:hypothetical protein